MWQYNYNYYAVDNSNYFKHYGVLGMKWRSKKSYWHIR